MGPFKDIFEPSSPLKGIEQYKTPSRLFKILRTSTHLQAPPYNRKKF